MGWMLEASDWERRTVEFRHLRTLWPVPDQRMVVMELDAAKFQNYETWTEIGEQWLEIPEHPNLLEAIQRSAGLLLLRYAAIDWRFEPIKPSTADRQIATWGVQLASVFATVAAHVPDQRAALLCNPIVRVDVGQHLRVGFLPNSASHPVTSRHMAPEVVKQWPSCDERGFVFLVGSLLRELDGRVTPGRALRTIVDTCTQPKPQHRYPSLAALERALDAANPHEQPVRAGDQLQAWRLAEAGVGLLATERPDLARGLFAAALAIQPFSMLAIEGATRVRELAGNPPPRRPPGVVDNRGLPVSWDDAHNDAAPLEAARAFDRALALYMRVPEDIPEQPALFLARARCHLELGEAGHAIDFARRALAADRSNLEAHRLHARALHGKRLLPEALAAAEALIAIAPHDALAHYLRGRSLFALGRLIEARDSFDRACALEPRLVAAMVLRHQTEQALGTVRGAVGVQPEMTIELPEHLSALRPILASGKIAEAIAILQGPAHATDEPALRLLAGCLLFEGRNVDALAIYDALHDQVGKAQALVELGRPEDALAALAGCVDNSEVLEVRARSLAALGRISESEREVDRLVASLGDRAELRGPRFRFK